MRSRDASRPLQYSSNSPLEAILQSEYVHPGRLWLDKFDDSNGTVMADPGVFADQGLGTLFRDLGTLRWHLERRKRQAAKQTFPRVYWRSLDDFSNGPPIVPRSRRRRTQHYLRAGLRVSRMVSRLIRAAKRRHQREEQQSIPATDGSPVEVPSNKRLYPVAANDGRPAEGPSIERPDPVPESHGRPVELSSTKRPDSLPSNDDEYVKTPSTKRLYPLPTDDERRAKPPLTKRTIHPRSVLYPKTGAIIQPVPPPPPRERVRDKRLEHITNGLWRQRDENLLPNNHAGLKQEMLHKAERYAAHPTFLGKRPREKLPNEVEFVVAAVDHGSRTGKQHLKYLAKQSAGLYYRQPRRETGSSRARSV